MRAVLHIQMKQDVLESPEEILAKFPFEPGQSIVAGGGGLIVVDLGGLDDTNYVQDWYLNSHEDVASFYVADD